MKSLTLRSSVALACALSLAACGGGGGNLLLGGSVKNLAKPGLVLQNKTGPLLPVAVGSASFVFNELIGNDQDFDVEIATQPTGAVCGLANNKGKSGAFNVLTVEVVCLTNTYDLGGKISGLDAAGLVLVNGDDRLAVAAGTTDFKLTKVADGAPYGVAVLTQPAGRTCSVQNGVGTMGSAAIDTIRVTCA
jgi:hypothetical protein